VIMKVIPQRVDQIDGIIAFVFARVAREKDESDVTDIVTDGSVGAFELGRWLFVRKEDLRCLRISPFTLVKFLKEYSA